MEPFSFLPDHLAFLFKTVFLNAELDFLLKFHASDKVWSLPPPSNTDTVLEYCLVLCLSLLWHCSVSAVFLRIMFLLSWVFCYSCSISKYVFSISTCQSTLPLNEQMTDSRIQIKDNSFMLKPNCWWYQKVYAHQKWEIFPQRKRIQICLFREVNKAGVPEEHFLERTAYSKQCEQVQTSNTHTLELPHSFLWGR